MAAGLRAVAALPDPVGEVVEGWVLAERPLGPACPGAARCRRHRLRESPERHLGRRGALPEVRQRGVPARLGGSPRLERGDRRRAAVRDRQGGPARRQRRARRGHPARDGRGVRRPARGDRLPRAPRRAGPRGARRRARDRALRRRRRRELPRLHRRRRRSRRRRAHRRQRQDPATGCLQRDGDPPRAPRDRATCALPRLARALAGVELVGDEATRASFPASRPRPTRTSRRSSSGCVSPSPSSRTSTARSTTSRATRRATPRRS